VRLNRRFEDRDALIRLAGRPSACACSRISRKSSGFSVRAAAAASTAAAYFLAARLALIRYDASAASFGAARRASSNVAIALSYCPSSWYANPMCGSRIATSNPSPCRLAAVFRHDRRQFVHDRLKLMTLAERLGQRVIAARRLRVQRDHAARRRFSRLAVARSPLRLRQQIQREGVGAAAAHHLGEHVARFDDVVAAAGVEQRLRVARFDLQIARRPRHDARVRRGGIAPAPLALVEVGQRRQQTRIVGGPASSHVMPSAVRPAPA
jgi:hypothetical protein